MVKIWNSIPSVESLMRRGARDEQVQPSENGKSFIRGKLDQFAYSRVNPEVYDAIVHYGAMLHEGIATKGLLLKGDVGIGKSYGVECLSAILGIPVYTPLTFVSLWKELQGDPLALEQFVFNGGDLTFGEPHHIIIDELGIKDTSRHYGEVADIMVDVLDMRYRAMIRCGVMTIVTTNLPDRELADRYGARINDRMNEMFFFRSVSGKSLRK